MHIGFFQMQFNIIFLISLAEKKNKQVSNCESFKQIKLYRLGTKIIKVCDPYKI